MFQIPEKGTRYRKHAVCHEAALSDPRRNETLHVFASELARHAMYEVANLFIWHNTYQGNKTGTMELDIVVMTQAEYAELARECYRRGMEDTSMELFYKEQAK